MSVDPQYENYVGHIKWKSAFEQNLQIQIILHICKVSRPLLSIHTFCSIRWFC